MQEIFLKSSPHMITCILALMIPSCAYKSYSRLSYATLCAVANQVPAFVMTVNVNMKCQIQKVGTPSQC